MRIPRKRSRWTLALATVAQTPLLGFAEQSDLKVDRHSNHASRYVKFVEPVRGLARSGNLPLPSAAPDSQGYFHPEGGYAEGGKFESPEEHPAWRVSPDSIAPRLPSGWVRACEWNVARGEKLADLIRRMKQINCDLWFLNETDLYGLVARGAMVAREMARALGYSYFAVAEFHELRKDRRGSSGNAVLSRYPLSDGRAMSLRRFTKRGGYDWAQDLFQPRRGRRSAASVYASIENGAGTTTRVNLVVLHTDNMANPLVRRLQFEAVRARLVKPGEPTIMAGDLNTLDFPEPVVFASYLERERRSDGASNAFTDCSGGRNRTTMRYLKLDWVLVQEGVGRALACFPERYRVEHSGDASDHRPVVVEIRVGSEGGS